MNKEFKDILFKLRMLKKISLYQMSKETHISLNTLKSWEQGKTKPRVSRLIVLSKYFGVRCDYLLGLSDKKDIARVIQK